MQRSHSRHSYPFEKAPDRSLKAFYRNASGRLSQAWRVVKRLQAKKRRLAKVDEFGVPLGAAHDYA